MASDSVHNEISNGILNYTGRTGPASIKLRANEYDGIAIRCALFQR